METNEITNIIRNGFTIPVALFPLRPDYTRACITCCSWLSAHHEDHGGRGHMCLTCGGGAQYGHHCHDCLS
jgi:hypothetical protein